MTTLTPKQLERIETRSARRWREVYKLLLVGDAEIVGITVNVYGEDLEFFSLDYTDAGDDVHIEVLKEKGAS
jgi:hypothetical protein